MNKLEEGKFVYPALPKTTTRGRKLKKKDERENYKKYEPKK